MPAPTPWKIAEDGMIRDARGRCVLLGDRYTGMTEQGPKVEEADHEDLLRLVLSVNILAGLTIEQLGKAEVGKVKEKRCKTK